MRMLKKALENIDSERFDDADHALHSIQTAGVTVVSFISDIPPARTADNLEITKL